MNTEHRELLYVSSNEQKSWHTIPSIHQDLLITKELLYDICHFKCSNLLREAESIEYGAYTFDLNDFIIRFRIAKITPTKAGHFVVLWKRNENGITEPYDTSDAVDFFVISTRKDNHFGQFVFPKSVLCKHDILSINGEGGKRGIRVYPPWEKTLNRQAQKTQQWQIEYFLGISPDTPIDGARAQMLYAVT